MVTKIQRNFVVIDDSENFSLVFRNRDVIVKCPEGRQKEYTRECMLQLRWMHIRSYPEGTQRMPPHAPHYIPVQKSFGENLLVISKINNFPKVTETSFPKFMSKKVSLLFQNLGTSFLRFTPFFISKQILKITGRLLESWVTTGLH